ncbi:MAG: hypothetical protein WD532_07070 [Acidimicrobiia bacterium]
MKPLTSGFLVAALLLSACGAGEPGTTPTDTQSDDVILTVTDEGGFAPVELLLGRHPRFVLQADGRLYTPGVVAAIYPGPMLTPIFVGTVDEADMDEILRLVTEAGLGDIDGRVDDTTAAAHIADATTTVVTYFDGEKTHTASVYALGIALESSELAEDVMAVVEALDRAAANIDDAVEYRPTRVEIRTGNGLALPDPEYRTTKPWPLETAPDELPVGELGWRCVVVEGPPATDLLELFGEATQATVWDYQGTEIALIARGLVPGAPGCR